MTAQEARALMPNVNLDELLKRIKTRSEDGYDWTWEKLDDNTKQALTNLGYKIMDSVIHSNSKISW
jgi:hypothetical protein